MQGLGIRVQDFMILEFRVCGAGVWGLGFHDSAF